MDISKDSQKRKIKIVFKKGTDFYSFLIRLFTGGHYTHCGIVIDDILYQAQTLKGVYCENWIPNFNWTVKNIDVEILFGNKAKNFLKSEIGCGYDWFGVLHFVLPFLKPSKKRWFCSELAAETLVKAGFLSKKKVSFYSPQSLFNCIEKKLDKNKNPF